jgi:membrane protein implicated in regulation of membrane protease activity
MTLDTLIMLAGVAIAALPFLGLPPNWDTILFVLLGVLVLALGIIVRRRSTIHSLPRQNERERAPLDDGEVA